MTGSVAKTWRPALDLYRAVAVMGIVFHHELADAGSLLVRAAVEPGWMMVDLFFVQSGYLIGSQLLRELQTTGRVAFGRFFARRALRVFPPYFVVLALFVAINPWRGATAQAWTAFVPYVFFVQNLIGSLPIFVPSWSLCVEEHFYLGFPLLVLLRGHRAQPLSARAVLSLVGGVLVLLLTARGMAWNTYVSGAGPAERYELFQNHIYFPTTYRLDGILLGVLLAWSEIKAPHHLKRLIARPQVLAACGLAGLGLSAWLAADRASLVGATWGLSLPAVASLALTAAALSPSFVLNKTMPGFVTWLARLSYCLYVSHGLVMDVLAGVDKRWLGLAAQHLLWLPALPLSLLAAMALQKWVEAPALRWRQRHG